MGWSAESKAQLREALDWLAKLGEVELIPQADPWACVGQLTSGERTAWFEIWPGKEQASIELQAYPDVPLHCVRFATAQVLLVTDPSVPVRVKSQWFEVGEVVRCVVVEDLDGERLPAGIGLLPRDQLKAWVEQGLVTLDP
jgi:hypothetical protein